MLGYVLRDGVHIGVVGFGRECLQLWVDLTDEGLFFGPGRRGGVVVVVGSGYV